jgi:hypothetical protein
MNEGNDGVAVDTGVDAQDEVTTAIGRSLSSIWERRDGVRPVAISTELEGDVIRCVIEPGERDPDAEKPEDGTLVDSIGTTAYRNEAMAAVGRVTHRKVKALIAKTVAKTGEATNTFVLERRVPRR